MHFGWQPLQFVLDAPVFLCPSLRVCACVCVSPRPLYICRCGSFTASDCAITRFNHRTMDWKKLNPSYWSARRKKHFHKTSSQSQMPTPCLSICPWVIHPTIIDLHSPQKWQLKMSTLKPNIHRRRRRDSTVDSSWVASAVWTHPSAVVSQFTIFCAVFYWS